VFVWNGKTYCHVGLYVGGDTVIEAQGTKAGVTTSKISATKWTHWGELSGVDYSGSGFADPVDPVPVSSARDIHCRGQGFDSPMLHSKP
jgi:hypothetical protein